MAQLRGIEFGEFQVNRPNHARLELYRELSELVGAMPDGLPDLIDNTFENSESRRGHIGSTNGVPWGVGPSISFLNTSSADKLELGFAGPLGLTGLEEKFWSRKDGYGTLRLRGSHYQTRIDNFLNHGLVDVAEPTAFQELLADYHRLAADPTHKKILEDLLAQGEPSWTQSAIDYVRLQESCGMFAEGITQQFEAYFRAHSPANYYIAPSEQQAAV